ncbi:MAG: biotin/lipoyl-binding protein [Phycisphaerales bacterium]|nr:biotin/lipoyl-binding protein [Phycisphaerales bacterium]
MASFLAVAIFGTFTWRELTIHPRTTDAFVRANVVGIAAHVSGNIVELNVQDNQRVRAGDVLFVVDPRPYEAALASAQAALALVDLEVEAYRRDAQAREADLEEAKAADAYAQDYLARVEPLLPERFVTPDEVKKARTTAQATAAAVRGAQARLDAAQRLIGQEQGADGRRTNARRDKALADMAEAQLNLDYCVVRAPVSGYVTNLNTARGEYANLGEEVFALVDDTQWFVLANYRETLLDRIEPGMEAEVWVLACPGQRLRGIVQGVGKAITPPAGATVNALADVEPAIDWVRLAQRFPVRILLEHPPDCTLHSGSTATVRVLTPVKGEGIIVDGVFVEAAGPG